MKMSGSPNLVLSEKRAGEGASLLSLFPKGFPGSNWLFCSQSIKNVKLLMKLPAPTLLILLIFCTAASADIFTAQKIRANVEINSSFQIVPEKSQYKIEYVDVNLSFFPKETKTQSIIYQSTYPVAQRKGDSFIYHFENPSLSESYSISTIVENYRDMPKVSKKIIFPYKNSASVKEFILPSKLIDSDNPGIIQAASEIAQGEDDAFVVVSKIAFWVKSNVYYNLSTLTADVSQNAGWVLEHRTGVCDEITNLFIAMARSVGIPARFVSGIAYTDSPLFPEGWGPHGWAEVYFPEIGWVPFDVTYGEFGFIDAAHITNKMTKDVQDVSTGFYWLGKDATVKSQDLDFNVTVDSQEEGKKELEVSANLLFNEISFSSYNIVEAVVKNPTDHYAAPLLELYKVEGLENIDGNERLLTIPPFSEKKAYWIVKPSGRLEKGYKYTYPISVITIAGESSESSFKAAENGQDVSINDVNSIIGTIKDENAKEYSEEIDAGCDSAVLNPGETGISCYVKNSGNKFLKNLRACIGESCTFFDLGISQQKNIMLNVSGVGKQKVFLIVNNTNASKSVPVDVEIFDKASMKFENTITSDNVRNGEKFSLETTLVPTSHSSPENLTVSMKTSLSEYSLFIKKLEGPQKIRFNLSSDDLEQGKNILIVEAKNNIYANTTANVSLEKLSMWQKISRFFRRILA